ncbi:MAG: exodeoxyribonuclease VII small subunit [Limnobacter sp.]|nr:exodeoxyribonuclease VII small subunit [Limnobacter sp.]
MSEASPGKNAPQSTPETFEQAMRELEELVARMDQPEAGLEGLLGDYKRGAVLVKYCRDRLNVVKKEMDQISTDLQGSGEEQ